MAEEEKKALLAADNHALGRHHNGVPRQAPPTRPRFEALADLVLALQQSQPRLGHRARHCMRAVPEHAALARAIQAHSRPSMGCCDQQWHMYVQRATGSKADLQTVIVLHPWSPKQSQEATFS